MAHGPLIESIGGQLIAKLLIETKAVPSSIVKRKEALQAQEIEAQTGRKPGKKEQREMREDILHSLLPQAFAKQGSVMVWVNPKDRLMAIDAGSTGKADEVSRTALKVKTSLTPMWCLALACWALCSRI